ncbi:acyclic terpene utilization AtuA family protein [Shimia biformata]|uniref:acyclic terpene utilization AtuA family protein n=1 Tax=Shimia biformata TaxID=1294299 RepID=UPI0019522B70|nr:acyclic terpene utilization AtuA family protein [Shimia biformata]
MTAIRIGGASGFWGDAGLATQQLLQGGQLDFLVYDYLAEITMAILARARAKDPEAGFATDFVTTAMAPNLPEIAAQGVRVITNAGGVNPMACAAALRAEIARQGLALKVAVVLGDDLTGNLDAMARTAPVEMFSGAPFPPQDKVGSVNAYLGAFPIAAALDRGADIVVTGRCVDSAVTLGAAIHAFGWQPGDLDALAGASLAGHVIECGPQATGGNFTDWQDVPGGAGAVGYPVAVLSRDGSFAIELPKGAGGLVTCATVGEQILYEIGDPQRYVLPDVICDFSAVSLKQVGETVQVSNAKGAGVPEAYKACLTWQDGYRGGGYFSYYGLDAAAKARAFADAAIGRARDALTAMNAPDFTETSIEILGAESQFGANARPDPAREVVLKLAARHGDARAIGLLLKEATGLALAAPPGLSGFAGTRPRPSPVLALFSFLTQKSDVTVRVEDEAGEMRIAPAPPIAAAAILRPEPPAKPTQTGATVLVPLIRLAWARSGDKGDKANIGVIARRPDLLPWIWHGLDEIHLRWTFGHFCEGAIERYYLPGLKAMNIVLDQALGGGGTSSLRNDPQAKGYAQLLLATEIEIDQTVLETLP